MAESVSSQSGNSSGRRANANKPVEPSSATSATAPKPSRSYISSGLGALVLALLYFTPVGSILGLVLQSTVQPDLCPINPKIIPESYLRDNTTALTILKDPTFRQNAVNKLSKAVQVETIVYDDPPEVDEDPAYWAKFSKFHDYLEQTFPLIHQHLELEKVNTYGLVYTWRGSNAALKPLMVLAHQDTVPIQQDTIEDWTFPPLNGHSDGKYIFGRGASDDKNYLLSVLEAIELLIEQGYKPQRSVIAAFGFDEEVSGARGAKRIGEFLERKLGKNSIYAIVDEGPGVMPDDTTGRIVALAGTSEKGYLDIQVELTAEGGHSSIPPDHTVIGIMGELAYEIEKDPYSPLLTRKNPLLKYMECLAVNTDLGGLTKKAILRASFDKFANSKVVQFLGKNKVTKYLIRTAQAIDLIVGGEKANALPENVRMVINHRIGVETTVAEIYDHFNSRVVKLAQKHNLKFESLGKVLYAPENNSGVLVLTSRSALEPAFVTPFQDNKWKYLAGTTRHVFENLVFPELTEPIIVAPLVMPGNTDTRHYWNLTTHIYRYSPFYAHDPLADNHVHSVDEKIEIDAHLQMVTFFHQYIQNIDTPDAD